MKLVNHLTKVTQKKSASDELVDVSIDKKEVALIESLAYMCKLISVPFSFRHSRIKGSLNFRGHYLDNCHRVDAVFQGILKLGLINVLGTNALFTQQSKNHFVSKRPLTICKVLDGCYLDVLTFSKKEVSQLVLDSHACQSS